MSDTGKEIIKTIEYININYHDVNIDKYVIMPNYVHMIIFLTGGHGNPPLPNVVGQLKSFTTKKWNDICGTQMQKIWQRSYHDHIIRNEEDYQNHWRYIEENPARWTEDEYY